MTRPWQKTIDFVDGLKRKLPDEELAVIKRYVEKRGREATQAHTPGQQCPPNEGIWETGRTPPPAF